MAVQPTLMADFYHSLIYIERCIFFGLSNYVIHFSYTRLNGKPPRANRSLWIVYYCVRKLVLWLNETQHIGAHKTTQIWRTAEVHTASSYYVCVQSTVYYIEYLYNVFMLSHFGGDKLNCLELYNITYTWIKHIELIEHNRHEKYCICINSG